MYWKVLILEIKDKYCLAMKEDGSVVRIIKKSNVKEGDTIYIVKEDLYLKEDENKVVLLPGFSGNKYKIKKSSIRKITAIAAAVAVFAIVLTVPQFAEKAYATVSFDGQKSVELKLNKNNKIMEAKSYNNTLTDEQLESLEGKNIFDMTSILKEFESKEDAILVAGASMIDEEKYDEIEIDIKNMISKYDTVYLKGDKNDVEEANKANKSLGIYIIEKAVDEDTLNELYEKVSPKDLDKLVKKYANKVYKVEKYNENNDKDDKDDEDEEKFEALEERREEKREAQEEIRKKETEKNSDKEDSLEENESDSEEAEENEEDDS